MNVEPPKRWMEWGSRRRFLQTLGWTGVSSALAARD